MRETFNERIVWSPMRMNSKVEKESLHLFQPTQG